MLDKTLKLWMTVLISTGWVDAGAQGRTVELKPIQRSGWFYYYDFKRISTPEALQIPLLAMEDYQVNRYYNSFKGLQEAGALVSLIPLAFVVYQLNSTRYDLDTLWWVFGGSIATNLALQILSHNRMKLAVQRYNSLLLAPPSGRTNSRSLPALSISFRL